MARIGDPSKHFPSVTTRSGGRAFSVVACRQKTATYWPAAEGGKRMVMLDGAGRPAAVVETVELTKRRFDEVDPGFAADEGEGDPTLAYWREAHRRYFTRWGEFELWCERFRVVARL
jgi:uncharacterized protein YhfF